MFDIGFSELVLIGIVALLVIGPERLPETVRTATVWLNRIRRGFNEIKQEVQQELHNDAVMRELRQTGEQLKQTTAAIAQDAQGTSEAKGNNASDQAGSAEAEKVTAEKAAE
jgi:sec-independent protein translocase protein TatB